jgi:hypothetical protein
MDDTDLHQRAREYAHRNNLLIGERLGSGVHGIVFAVKHQTKSGRFALKVHERGKDYRRERDVYLRLRDRAVTGIRGCNVPELIAFDDEQWVIEMTLVDRPFVLDFAGAYLDNPPDYSDDILAEWRAEKQEQFGPRWPEVQAILRVLEGHGVFVSDVNPGNIFFGD